MNDYISNKPTALDKVCSECIGTFVNEPWEVFFKRTRIEPSELWGSEDLVKSAGVLSDVACVKITSCLDL